jgi:cytochrome c-type biogenesis protein CcmH/NrfF
MSARQRAFWVGGVAALVLLLSPAAAAEPSPSDVATSVAQNVMSPFCPGLTLHDCPSDAAVDLRARIEGWAREGWSRTAIMTRLRNEYGPAVAAAPDPRGRGLVAWLLPLAAVVAGALVVTVRARRWSSSEHHPATRPDLSRGERARLDRELARIRSET